VLCSRSAGQLLSVFLPLVCGWWIRQSKALSLPSDTFCVVWDPEQILGRKAESSGGRDHGNPPGSPPRWADVPASRGRLSRATHPDPPPAVASGRTQGGQINAGTALCGSVQDTVRARGSQGTKSLGASPSCGKIF